MTPNSLCVMRIVSGRGTVPRWYTLRGGALPFEESSVDNQICVRKAARLIRNHGRNALVEADRLVDVFRRSIEDREDALNLPEMLEEAIQVRELVRGRMEHKEKGRPCVSCPYRKNNLEGALTQDEVKYHRTMVLSSLGVFCRENGKLCTGHCHLKNAMGIKTPERKNRELHRLQEEVKTSGFSKECYKTWAGFSKFHLSTLRGSSDE